MSLFCWLFGNRQLTRELRERCEFLEKRILFLENLVMRSNEIERELRTQLSAYIQAPAARDIEEKLAPQPKSVLAVLLRSNVPITTSEIQKLAGVSGLSRTSHVLAVLVRLGLAKKLGAGRFTQYAATKTTKKIKEKRKIHAR